MWQDVNLVHLARAMMFPIALRKSLLLTLLDFCQAFGANIRKVVSGMDGVDAAIASAKAKYLELRFDEVLDVYRHGPRVVIPALVDHGPPQALQGGQADEVQRHDLTGLVLPGGAVQLGRQAPSRQHPR